MKLIKTIEEVYKVAEERGYEFSDKDSVIKRGKMYNHWSDVIGFYYKVVDNRLRIYARRYEGHSNSTFLVDVSDEEV